MKTDKNILIAFILNLAFSVFELFGGIFTGSVAILSDALHDVGDAVSIGISYFLERKSRRKPDGEYTYGYARYSVLGGFITTLILLLGSAAVIFNAVYRIISPVEIDHRAMLVFAFAGVFVNLCAVLCTRKGDSLNQKAVNLHMLEDVLGWSVVLAGAVAIRFTGMYFIDSAISVCVSLFIVAGALKNIKRTAEVLCEKVPCKTDIARLKSRIENIGGVIELHHIHVWSMDGQNKLATMHIVTDAPCESLKRSVRKELSELGIAHATLELEIGSENCNERICRADISENDGHCYHHHERCAVKMQ